MADEMVPVPQVQFNQPPVVEKKKSRSKIYWIIVISFLIICAAGVLFFWRSQSKENGVGLAGLLGEKFFGVTAPEAEFGPIGELALDYPEEGERYQIDPQNIKPDKIVEYGEPFELLNVGETAQIRDENVFLVLTDISSYCAPAVINEEFVSGEGCPGEYVREVAGYALVTGGKIYQAEEEMGFTTRPYPPFTIRHTEGSFEFEIFKADEACLGKTGDEARYCWFSAAHTSGDYQLCNNIPPESRPAGSDTVDYCILDVAKTQRDPKICQAITNQEYKDNCFEELAWFVDQALCEKVMNPKANCACLTVEDKIEQQLCIERAFGEMKLGSAVPDYYCQKIESPIGACLAFRAAQRSDLSLCSEIKDYAWEVNCYKEFIRVNKLYLARPQGIAVCDGLESAAKRERCKEVVTKEGLDQ